METKSYDLPIGAALRLQSRSGRVHVIAEDRGDVEAATDRLEDRVDEDGNALLIRSELGGTKALVVRCSTGTDVSVGTHSGQVKLEGRLGAVSVTTMSGDIDLADAEEADLRSMSGSVTVGTVRGRCRMSAVSGRIVSGAIDSARASTISGSIKLGRVLGDVRAKSVSGSVDLTSLGDGSITVKTVSGKVRIVVPEGTEPQTFFKSRGKVRCDCPPGRDCRIEAASLSGSIDVVTE